MPHSGSPTPSSTAARAASPSPTYSAAASSTASTSSSRPPSSYPARRRSSSSTSILEYGAGRPDLAVADVGTGSGAIAVAAAVNLPSCRVYATDASEAALRVARDNCRMHGVEDRVELRRGDLLDPQDVRVDVIASNPPYVMTGEIEGLGREIGREPVEALDGGTDGLDVIRRLFEQAPAALKPGGAVLVEIDPRQLQPVTSLAAAAFPNGRVSHRRDLSGRPRVVVVAA